MSSGTPGQSEDGEQLDPKRWLALIVAVVAAFIVVLDNTVLNVSIPTIIRDLHTTLPSLEWVITGYALTFAALLIIGGRLGDIYGHRRIFIIGAAFSAWVPAGLNLDLRRRVDPRRGHHRGHRGIPHAAYHPRHPLRDLQGS